MLIVMKHTMRPSKLACRAPEPIINIKSKLMTFIDFIFKIQSTVSVTGIGTMVAYKFSSIHCCSDSVFLRI